MGTSQLKQLKHEFPHFANHTTSYYCSRPSSLRSGYVMTGYMMTHQLYWLWP